jgi:hypothetical protein
MTSFADLQTEPIASSTSDLIVFDDAPQTEETASVSLEIKDETIMLGNLLAKANEEVASNVKQAPSFFAEETVSNEIKFEEPKKEEPTTNMFSFEEPKALEVKPSIAKTLEDPNAILNESITRLDSLHANHELVKQEKIEEVANINKQIAALKKEGAQLGKEIDQINAQQEKVIDMKKLFESQKAA